MQSPMMRRPPMGRKPGVSPQQLEQIAFSETWRMYDTRYVGAAVQPGESAVFNFANWAQTIAFFNSHTIAGAGTATTSMTTTTYVDFPFNAMWLSVEVFCDADAAISSAIATSRAFVEAVCNYSAVELRFATDLKFVAPVIDLPAGGGVNYGFATDTRALASGQYFAPAGNGLPTAQAVRYFDKPILFRAGPEGAFTVNLVTQATAVSRIQALTALSGNLQAGVRIIFGGQRGKRLLPGGHYRG